MKMASPPGTVCCFMCKGMVIYKKGDKSRFNNHMNNEHGVVFELDFLFATCKLNEDERVKVKDVIENELMVEQDEIHEFNEESVKMQLRKIIPVINSFASKEPAIISNDQINCQFCNKMFSLETSAKRQFFKLHVQNCQKHDDDDDDIEVIKSVSAADKSIDKASKDSVNDGMTELEQISKRRRLSGNSGASSTVSAVSSTITKLPHREFMAKQQHNKTESSAAGSFKIPSSVIASSSVQQTPRKTQFLVPTISARSSQFLVPISSVSKPKHVPQTPSKSNPRKGNMSYMQTPKKANLKTPMKAPSNSAQNTVQQTPMKTPRKSNQKPMPPPSTVKKRTSGYAPHMFPCDQCDKGYQSKSSLSQHMKHKHTGSSPAVVKLEKPAEVLSSIFPLLDQGNPTADIKGIRQPDDIPSPIQPSLAASLASSETTATESVSPTKLSIKLFTCDGCEKSYPSSMKLKMHKKRSCKAVPTNLSVSIKTELIGTKASEDESIETTLEETVNPEIEKGERKEDASGSKVAEESVQSETDEIQNMLMLDNSDDDDDDDEDIEVVDIVVDQTPKVPIGQIKNETQVEINDRVEKAEKIEEHGDDGEKQNDGTKDTSEAVEMEESLNIESEARNKMFEELLQSKYFMDQPAMFSKCSEANLPSFLKPISFLPGWKLKKNEVKKKSGERIPATHFLSPDNIVIRSGLGVLEYLRLSGSKPEELNTLSLRLKVKPKNFETYVGKYMFDL